MRDFEVKHPCACSAEAFWGLREDPEWDTYNANLDEQTFSTDNVTVTTESGEEVVTRTHKLKHWKNPVPRAMRSSLGVSQEFSVRVTAIWFKRKFDIDHAMKLNVRMPMMTDRFKINGIQWVEKVDEHNCLICSKMKIQCKIPGPGLSTKIEKDTEKGMKETYADTPRRVVDFLTLRKRSGKPYPDPFSKTGEPSAFPAAVCIGVGVNDVSDDEDAIDDDDNIPDKAGGILTTAPSAAKISALHANLTAPLLEAGAPTQPAVSQTRASQLGHSPDFELTHVSLAAQRAALHANELHLMKSEAAGAIAAMRMELEAEKATSTALRQQVSELQAALAAARRSASASNGGDLPSNSVSTEAVRCEEAGSNVGSGALPPAAAAGPEPPPMAQPPARQSSFQGPSPPPMPRASTVSPLSEGLRSIGFDEGLLNHVGLGSSLLLATERRFICVRKPSWKLVWQVEYASVDKVEAVDGAASVTLILKPPYQPVTIDCVTTAVVPLVEEMARATLRDVAISMISQTFP